METSALNIEKLQKKVAQCLRSECPSAKVCLRQIVRSKCDKTLETVLMVNPDAIEMKGDKCQMYQDSKGKTYGIGFEHYFDLLSYKEAKAAYAVLLAYFNSRTQLGRYRSGQLRISPERKAEIDALLQENGVSQPLECDAYEVDL